MSDATLGVLVTAAIGILTLCVTVFLWVNTRMAAISEKIDAKIDASEQKNSQARHDINNKWQVDFGRTDIRLSQLEREVVRDSDLRQTEERIGTQITELKQSLKDSNEKLGDKLTKLTEAVIRGEVNAAGRAQTMRMERAEAGQGGS